jgi:hypothetical protein
MQVAADLSTPGAASEDRIKVMKLCNADTSKSTRAHTSHKQAGSVGGLAAFGTDVSVHSLNAVRCGGVERTDLSSFGGVSVLPGLYFLNTALTTCKTTSTGAHCWTR